MKTLSRILIAMVAVASTAALHPHNARAVLVTSHLGNADPTTEGWTASASGTGVTSGGIVDGTTPAWFVDDSSTEAGSFFFYSHNPTAQEISDAAAIGWILSTTIRIPSSSDASISNSPFLAYRDGTKSWQLGFEVVSGDTRVQAITGVTANTTTGLEFTVPGTSTYNTFELRYDPVASTADLFVNGVEQISNYAGLPLVDTAKVLWGAGSSADIGRGNFNAVSFEIAPVPEASPLLFGSVICAALAWWSGFQRKRGVTRRG